MRSGEYPALQWMVVSMSLLRHGLYKLTSEHNDHRSRNSHHKDAQVDDDPGAIEL
jgi:hypothetical protein